MNFAEALKKNVETLQTKVTPPPMDEYFECEDEEEFQKRFPEHPFFPIYFENPVTFWKEKIVVSNWDEVMAYKKAAAALAKKLYKLSKMGEECPEKHDPPLEKVEKNFVSEKKIIAKSHSISTFWLVFNHLLPLMKEVEIENTFHVMRGNIEPMWEDPMNVKGGRFTFRVPKTHIADFFKCIVTDFVGGTMELEAIRPGDQICGITVTPRQTDDLVIVWNFLAAQEGDVKIEGTETFEWQAVFISYVQTMIPDVPLTSAFYKNNTSHKKFSTE